MLLNLVVIGVCYRRQFVMETRDLRKMRNLSEKFIVVALFRIVTKTEKRIYLYF